MCGGKAAANEMHFLSTANVSREDFARIVDSALRFKRGTDQSKPLAGKSVALVFFNPSLALADMMTVREKLGSGRKRVLLMWAWHPKALPMAVPNSFALAAAQMGHDLVIAHPKGYELDDELISETRKHATAARGSVT